MLFRQAYPTSNVVRGCGAQGGDFMTSCNVGASLLGLPEAASSFSCSANTKRRSLSKIASATAVRVHVLHSLPECVCAYTTHHPFRPGTISHPHPVCLCHCIQAHLPPNPTHLPTHLPPNPLLSNLPHVWHLGPV